ncbi:hypothetical protein [Streptomyces cylindrosporus]|uniref:4Fe-4S Wbl-type domain-containing protein n=1 Tax=Streptomyces cylindrosporus TaxID=2927583 RepID=A0ABS9Y2I5_9ACTN|nr:hypothetical protein [Streptomyces cylindrosporus]MCI3271429.1 hypothetical protein [Streptomyces cylindrosporus]
MTSEQPEDDGLVLPLLDWRDSSHWSQIAKPCRYCEEPTQMRDSKYKPAHKLCAERALAQQAAEAADAYQIGKN